MNTDPSELRPRAPSLPPQCPTAAWRRAFRDLAREHGFEALRTDGAIPTDLRGTLYRNGAAGFGPRHDRVRHWFDGDGAVSAVRFTEHGVFGAARFVETAHRDAERAAGRRLYATYGTPAPTVFRHLSGLFKQAKNSANTSVMLWQGRLYALVESSPPVELSQDDLHAFGERDLGGAVVRTFSAHPHRVPSRQTTYNFGVRYGRVTELDLYALPDVGAARKILTLPLAGSTMLHDFIVTERHAVFFAPPLRLDLTKLLLSRASYSDSLAWRPELGTEVIVVPLDAPSEALRFTVDPFYQWHFANAFERDETLVVDLVRYDDFSSNEYLQSTVGEVQRGRIDGAFERAEVSLSRRAVRFSRVFETSCEFPRVADAALARPYRHAYLASQSPNADGMPDTLVKLDPSTGAHLSFTFGPGQYPSEPVFVPSADARADDHGHLVTLVYDALRDVSFAAVLDARDPSQGPVARAFFDHPIPLTFHGIFAPA